VIISFFIIAYTHDTYKPAIKCKNKTNKRVIMKHWNKVQKLYGFNSATLNNELIMLWLVQQFYLNISYANFI